MCQDFLTQSFAFSLLARPSRPFARMSNGLALDLGVIALRFSYSSSFFGLIDRSCNIEGVSKAYYSEIPANITEYGIRASLNAVS